MAVNADGAAPDNSAMLDIQSENKGFLPPRVALTAANSDAPVTSPASGLLIYNTTHAGISPNNVVPGYYYWNGNRWISIAAPQGTQPGDMLLWNGTQWVVIPIGTNGQSLVINNGMPTWWGYYSAQIPSVATDIVSSIYFHTAYCGGFALPIIFVDFWELKD